MGGRAKSQVEPDGDPTAPGLRGSQPGRLKEGAQSSRKPWVHGSVGPWTSLHGPLLCWGEVVEVPALNMQSSLHGVLPGPEVPGLIVIICTRQRPGSLCASGSAAQRQAV